MYQNDIARCLETLERGGTILYPTDTIWGIGCDATNEAAVRRIYEIKNRNESKSMIVLLADESEIPSFTRQRSLQIYDYIKGIRKPTTVIYRDACGLAPNLINADGTVGIRIVKEPFCVELIRRFGKPIVSTSSNVSGYPPPSIFSDIDQLIRQSVDYVVEYRQDDLTPGEPSTVIRIGDDGSIDVLRP